MTDQPLNREQRRAAERGTPDNRQDNVVPESQNKSANRAGGAGQADDSAPDAAEPGQDVARQAGAGSGGATEDDDRITNREGIHLGNQPNS